MKKTISTLAALALLTTALSAADAGYDDYSEDSSSKKFYAGGGLAFEMWPDEYGADGGNGIALLLNGGMALDQVTPGFGVEAEMSFDISGPSYEYSYGGWYGTPRETYTIDYSLFTMAGYATYSYHVNPKFFVRGRAGLIYKSLNVDSSSGYNYASDASEFGVAFGGGAYYSVTDSIDVYGDLTFVDFTDFIHFTVGAQYKFDF